MTDHFSRLECPRRPLVDPERLKEQYLRKSEETHRGTASEEDLSELNAAFQVLNNPATRLEYLLRTDCGTSYSQDAGPEVEGLFGEVAATLEQVDKGLAQASANSSPILKALSLQKLKPLDEELERIESLISRQEEANLQQMQILDANWDQKDEQVIESLRRVAANLRFLQRWKAQLRERHLRIADLESLSP